MTKKYEENIKTMFILIINTWKISLEKNKDNMKKEDLMGIYCQNLTVHREIWASGRVMPGTWTCCGAI